MVRPAAAIRGRPHMTSGRARGGVDSKADNTSTDRLREWAVTRGEGVQKSPIFDDVSCERPLNMQKIFCQCMVGLVSSRQT